MKNENYFVVQGFMINDLKLKGNELLVYAIIFGFSQNENTYNGSINYLCEFTNATRPTVISSLKSLCEKGFIIKQEEYENGVKFCNYKCNEKIFTGGKEIFKSDEKIFTGGSKEILPNNKDIYINKDNKDIHSIIELFNTICVSLPQVKQITDRRIKAVKNAKIDDYVAFFNLVEESDFLSGRTGQWKASFDWIMKPSNVAKIIEGNYANRNKQADEFDKLKRWAENEN